MTMLMWAWALVILGMFPWVLYLVGRIRDPFHPLLFMGTVTVSVVSFRLIRYYDVAVGLLREEFYTSFILFTILCLCGVYAGWWLAGRRTRHYREHVVAPELRMGTMLACGAACSVVGTAVFYLTYQQWELTGYLREWAMLWITGAILLIQVMIYTNDPSQRMIAVPFLLLSFANPIDRFFVYGQRGDTFRMAVMAMLVFLCLKRRPAKPVFLVAAISLAIVMATIERTRALVNNGDANNRIEALAIVIPSFFESRAKVGITMDDFSTGSEVFYGAAVMQTVRDTGRYGYATGITTGLIQRFLPKDLFDKQNIRMSIPHAGTDPEAIKSAINQQIAYGSAPTGFANAFGEMGWFGCLIWFGIAYAFRVFWDKAIVVSDPRAQGYVAGFYIACVYALTQELVTGEVNFIFVFVPLFLVYKLATVKHAPASFPVLTG